MDSWSSDWESDMYGCRWYTKRRRRSFCTRLGKLCPGLTLECMAAADEDDRMAAIEQIACPEHYIINSRRNA